MKKIIISEEERNRILGMHVEATKKHYGLVSEQWTDLQRVSIDGIFYALPGISTQESLDNFQGAIKDKETLYAFYKPNSVNLWRQDGNSKSLLMKQENFEPTLDVDGKLLLKTIRLGLGKIAEQGKLLTHNELNSVLPYGVIPLDINQQKVDKSKLALFINDIAKNIAKHLNIGTIPDA